MKFKSIASPPPAAGVRIKEPKQVVPNQSMSLQEILTRFTRGEKLEVGHSVSYHEGEYDLEKVQASDLVDKAEFIEKMQEVKREYDKQEKAKAKAAKAKELRDLEAKIKAKYEAEQENVPQQKPKKSFDE